MVTIGIDAHKLSHTLVAIDEHGAQLAELTVKANAEGHDEAMEWAREWPEHEWAVEDCRHVTRNLERDLLRGDAKVLRVPPALTATHRRSDRRPGKSDPIDALAVARAAQREPGLDIARLDGPDREIRLLVDHRDDLVAERTRQQNRLRWHLHELDPSFEVKSLSAPGNLAQVTSWLDSQDGVLARIAREQVEHIAALTARVDALQQELALLVAGLAPRLLELEGCGVLTAAKIIGEVGGVSRYRSRAAFAQLTGTAPIPVWSGNTDHHRLNRGGNRQLNSALHRIAVTQIRRRGLGYDYRERLLALGKTKRDAMRILRRRLSDEVYRRLVQDEAALVNEKFPEAA